MSKKFAFNTESWLKSLGQGEDVDAIFIDFCKAFDWVDHGILISVLNDYKFPMQLLRWVRDYLQERTFKVRVNRALSQSFTIESVVLQGSVLAPMLFNMYVNKLPSRLPSNNVMFADEIKTWSSIER